MNTLQIIDLHAKINKKGILKGLNLTIKSGEIHAVMGPNGSGKSTLCNVVMGHPKYEVTKGKILFNGKNIINLEPNERANLGIFLGFQQPIEVSGINLGNFLRIAKNSNLKALDQKAPNIGPAEFMKQLQLIGKELKIKEEFIKRSINEGLSGGEKKRSEILQMAMLEPKIALLDEIDSGLDIDALKKVAQGIQKTQQRLKTGILLITHYQRILNYVTPDFVHIMTEGKIVKSGDKKLAHKLEKEGYEKYIS